MTVRNHVLGTQSLIVRGLVAPLVERLGDYLRHEQRRFVTLTDAEVRNLANDQTGLGGNVRVGVDAIVWAHEFVALTGDEFRRRHHDSGDERPLIVTMDRPEDLVIAGWYAESWPRDASFFVVRRPKPEGRTPLAASHAEIIAPLPWILVNRKAVAVIAEA
jgi:hypothetical protein